MDLEVVVVELGQGIAFVGGFGGDVLVYPCCHAALCLETVAVYGLL
jgi:hypothetical protein